MIILCVNQNWGLIFSISIPSLLVIAGWIVVYLLNRKNEIAKELRGYRIDMLKSIMHFIDVFHKNDISLNPDIRTKFNDDKIKRVQEIVSTKIFLYGKDDEIAIFMDFLDSCGQYKNNDKHNNLQKLITSLTKLANLCQNNIRKELNLEKLNAN